MEDMTPEHAARAKEAFENLAQQGKLTAESFQKLAKMTGKTTEELHKLNASLRPMATPPPPPPHPAIVNAVRAMVLRKTSRTRLKGLNIVLKHGASPGVLWLAENFYKRECQQREGYDYAV